VVAVDLHPMDWLLARAVLVVAEMDQRGLVRRLLLLRLILEAVAVVVLARVAQAAQAVPASSSSSTTSALPQSSPSSHRRSGLHQRVR